MKKLKVLMCGYRKGAKTADYSDLNAKIFKSEEELIDSLAELIDTDDKKDKRNWLFKPGTDFRYKTKEIITIVKITPVRCESKDNCFLFIRV